MQALDAVLGIKDIESLTLIITKVEINGFTLRDVNNLIDSF